MGEIKTYRDLIAWQKAMSLARAVYKATADMPRTEQLGLTIQMRRAAVSVPSNIAEGYGRGSTNDYLRFLRLSRGSLAELATQHEIATSMGMMKDDPLIQDLLDEVERILQGLIRSVKRRATIES